LESIRHVNANIFTAINKKGYQDIVLDFGKCETINTGAMAAICAQISSAKKNRIDFSLMLPENERLKRLFINANWAHYIEERRFSKSEITAKSHVPLIHYLDSDQQQDVVNKIIEAMLSVVEGLYYSGITFKREKIPAFSTRAFYPLRIT